ncbi:M28 family peptidase [Altererythrobacter sp. SALINAS58]|uniref:M28 family metallopeptidase n=1 Tax=Alteripontixanthobacter muriae TaxID=2705546 RepID=UPI0015764CBD|nr:M28 family peptidase [Alteripontixanthobacter muriae]NTZ43064.1 M28 family peptidase [Alteripontixanthobacter muriae]
MTPASQTASAESKDEAALARHIGTLASDAFEGRRPGTPGEAKTLSYLAREWQSIGLRSGTNDPANPWFAPVRLNLAKPEVSTANFRRNRRYVEVCEDEVRIFTSGLRGLTSDARVLFVGQTAEFPAGALAGRVAVMLADHAGSLEQRQALFDGGAVAVLSVVADKPALAQIAEMRNEGAYRLDGEGEDRLDGFVSAGAMARIVGPERWRRWQSAAKSPGFRPQQTGATVTLEAVSAPADVLTHNLIARLPGKDPEKGAVLVLAHWDHFGICAPQSPTDQICNGAIDNASGLAVLTELARKLASGPPLERDVYFLATTAEEWGLLGARAFLRDPPVPLDTIVAAFNLDTVAGAPRDAPVAVIGKGMTPLDDVIASLIVKAGRQPGNDDFASEYLKRQDGWALLQGGVPAVMVTSAFGDSAVLRDYIDQHYHSPSDEAEGLELGGAAQDLLLHEALVRHFADPDQWPVATGD